MVEKVAVDQKAKRVVARYSKLSLYNQELLPIQ